MILYCHAENLGKITENITLGGTMLIKQKYCMNKMDRKSDLRDDLSKLMHDPRALVILDYIYYCIKRGHGVDYNIKPLKRGKRSKIYRELIYNLREKKMLLIWDELKGYVIIDL